MTAAAASPASAATPFEPIVLEHIHLPAPIHEASTPTWTTDGHHLLFSSGGHLWIVGEHGGAPTCLTCGLANEPKIPLSDQEALAYAFPDGRRAAFGAYGAPFVLECAPSLVACSSRRLLPVDLSSDQPPGAPLILGRAVWHLAPDGVHMAWSTARTDVAELMVVGTMVRHSDKYVTVDAKVVNPPGPKMLGPGVFSPFDTNPVGWSQSANLYELKAFADGGASVTYVSLPDAGNPDVLQVNLASGATTRLTYHPDWDEDDAPSPDGRSLVLYSDRQMHRADASGLLPYRGFVALDAVVAGAIYLVSSPAKRECDLQPWLLPASGDDHGDLMGQPLDPYTGGDLHGSNNIAGAPQWSPDGTRIALNEQSYATTFGGPELLVAHLVARKPTAPVPVVSSAVGAWAVSPKDYYGAIASNTTLTVHGLATGTATISYTGNLLAGVDNARYSHYSDDGRTFVDGRVTSVDTANALGGPETLTETLTLSGAHHGYRRATTVYYGKPGGTTTVKGSAETSYDGTTLTGIPKVGPCPDALPRRTPLAVRPVVRYRGGRARVIVHVTASIAGAGATERGVDTRPVLDATVRIAGRRAHTNAAGDAALTVRRTARRRRLRIAVSAGDTMVPATATISVRRKP